MNIEQKLTDWFERQKRVLPWRSQPTIYRVWISEIMLQQTQVVTVVPFFERFIERFPSVEVLAAASEEEVLKHWAGLGYYSRARNIHKAARLIVARGAFPEDREGWESLPGVGPYTAGAVLSIALDQPEAILDGNVERVLSRMERVGVKQRLWELSRRFVARGAARGVRPSALNQALMELGATVCSVKNPRCSECPLMAACQARKAGKIGKFPPPKKPRKWIAVEEELHCVLDGEGRVLLRQRSEGEWRAGLWDLPEKAPGAGTAKRVGEIKTRHVVTNHKISRTTQVWTTAVARKAPKGHRWVLIEDPEVAVGSALRKTLAAVRGV